MPFRGTSAGHDPRLDPPVPPGPPPESGAPAAAEANPAEAGSPSDAAGPGPFGTQGPVGAPGAAGGWPPLNGPAIASLAHHGHVDLVASGAAGQPPAPPVPGTTGPAGTGGLAPPADAGQPRPGAVAESVSGSARPDGYAPPPGAVVWTDQPVAPHDAGAPEQIAAPVVGAPWTDRSNRPAAGPPPPATSGPAIDAPPGTVPWTDRAPTSGPTLDAPTGTVPWTDRAPASGPTPDAPRGAAAWTDRPPAASGLVGAAPPGGAAGPVADFPPTGFPAPDTAAPAPEGDGPTGGPAPEPGDPREPGGRPGTPGVPSPAPAGGSRRGVIVGVAVGTALALATGVLGGALVDTRVNAGRPARRLDLAGQDIGGMDDAALARTVEAVAADARAASVVLRTPTGETTRTAADLGVTLDAAATVAAARAVDQDVALPRRVLRVVRSWFVHRPAPLVFGVDRARLAEGLRDLSAATDQPATEPGVALEGAAFTVTPPVDGQRIDVAALAAHLDDATRTPAPWTVDVPVARVAPRFTTADAQRLADRANTLATKPITVVAGSAKVPMTSEKVRSWLRAVPGPGGLVLQADAEAVTRDVTDAVGTTPPVDAGLKVVGDPAHGRVEVVPEKPGLRCCAPGGTDRVAEAVLAGKSTVTVDMIPEPAKHDRAWAEGLHAVEPVGSFTTNHACCEARVTNIHLMADAVRGAVIEPGASFSLNQRVGQRTPAKGYKEAGVIYDGVMSTDVGGGVSQFTTTLFNAAFFGGYDLTSYMSHSLYIERYPYGREATISWPSPDLVIRNPSPYGILIWPTYDDTSITVHLYSTRWATGEQTGQSSEPKGNCTRVRTERTRTFVDGRKEVDAVFATYQPAQGVRC
jgi:vancomycin resistance protein YoaR